MLRRLLPVALLPALAFVAWAVEPAPLALAAASPKKLVEAYFKAKNDKDRAKAWDAILAAPPLDTSEVPALRDVALALLAKRGRRIGKDRDEWFDEDKDGWKGLYIVSGKGSNGLVLSLHGGGAGSGDCSSSHSAFGGAISSLKMRGVYPEVLRKTEYGWTDPPDTERFVLDLLRAARRTWDVDPDRVYVTGHSMGGYGTWTYGSIHADLFAAGAAFAGAPTVFWKPGMKDKEAEGVVEGVLPNLYNLPLFVYQSLDDPQVPAAANVFAAARLAALHESDPKGWEYVYEQVDGRGHAFPEKGPGPGLEWMASHVRNPRPTKIRWQPVRDWKTTFYWVRWREPWLRSVLVAEVDRERNAIDIVIERPRAVDPVATEAERAGRVATLSVLLDDDLLDTTKEVVVTVDGTERYRGVPERRLATLVQTAQDREDARYVFAAEVEIGAPSATPGAEGSGEGD